MKNYWLVRLGKGNVFAAEGIADGYIGIGFFENIDLSAKLYENWREFNAEMIPVFIAENPEKSRIAAGLACGNTHTVIKGIKIGDIVLCPKGNRTFEVGEVVGDYEYVEGVELPHRRKVRWLTSISRDDMSQGLSNTAGAIMTAFSLSPHTVELANLIDNPAGSISGNNESIEDPTIFGLEKHLEDFLVDNWQSTALGKTHDIYQDEGEIIGQQFQSDTGPIDILAISKDKKELLVVELKKGRASDVVVGQIQRYMGYVKSELAEKDQRVTGLIIALEDDLKLKRALSVTQDIKFMSYEVKFTLK